VWAPRQGSSHNFLKYWRITGRGEFFQAQVVNYADDFVILSSRKAAEALDWTRTVMSRIGLTLNETKTYIRQANAERFDFLGYTFGPHRFRKNGSVFLGESPSKKSVARLRQKVGDLMKSGNMMPWPDVRDRLNATLRGWCRDPALRYDLHFPDRFAKSPNRTG
jgi:RNA-directed DNA polymerase